MNNFPIKNIQGSTPVQYSDLNRRTSDTFFTPTPLAQQTPQLMAQVSFANNLASPANYIVSPNIINKSSNIDLLHQASNLQQNYSNINIAYNSPNYNNAQTPAMNIGKDDKNYNNIKNYSPNSPRYPLNSLAGSSPGQPNNITMYRAQQNNLPSDMKNMSIKNSLNFPMNKETEPKLQNIVSTANLGCQLKLRQIALQARNAEYNPKRFAAVIMRIREPKTTALIFSSGKMVCTGAKSEEDSKKASRKYAKIIKSLGFPVEFKDFKVQNIVGSCDVKFQISLSKLNIHLGKLYNGSEYGSNKNKKYICHYEPEIFPGLIYHNIDPEIVLLIFVSGKIVLTGAKERQQIYDAFEKIYPVLHKFKLENKNGKNNKMLHQDEVKEMKEYNKAKQQEQE